MTISLKLLFFFPLAICYFQLLFFHLLVFILMSFPGSSAGKESVCSAGDPGSTPGLGRSPEEGIGYTLQYSCLENPHGQRSLEGYSPWGCKELETTEQLSTFQGEMFSMTSSFFYASCLGKHFLYLLLSTIFLFSFFFSLSTCVCYTSLTPSPRIFQSHHD